ncbi:Aste57867_15541 [Aphanomyces stellatus]|uniref:Aste57867_15541 protein n=1 Tax=Aphanomyces stellatus TaxID=120398 RepID=A0A485L3D7_9STRA|nr:hypothetical protein As57867_015485 [Aphanomyces stellatus]VFT92343.1 Aste57867_15541 [Aphanomyces stellatus]
MFYWYVESEANPSTNPVVLWLSSGPGCSSLGALFTEVGPFVVESDLSVKRNPYAWYHHANVIFLDSPEGVEFSQPPLDVYNDAAFLDAFFTHHHPALRGRDLYLSGESNAGMYIPFLIEVRHRQPTHRRRDRRQLERRVLYSLGLISLHDYTTLTAHCQTLTAHCQDALVDCLHTAATCPAACNAILDATILDPMTMQADPYYHRCNVCLLENHQAMAYQSRKVRGMRSPSPRRRCNDAFATEYLNMPAVPRDPRAARRRRLVPVQRGRESPVRQERVDAAGQWIHALNLPRTSAWRAWVGPDDHVAGYLETYTEGLTFRTVQGTGHMVPAMRPLQALYMFECFVFPDHCATFDYPTGEIEDVVHAAAAVVTSGSGMDAWVFFAAPVGFLVHTMAVVVCVRTDDRAKYRMIPSSLSSSVRK